MLWGVPLRVRPKARVSLHPYARVSLRAESSPHARDHAIQQDDAIEEDRKGDILPGGYANHLKQIDDQKEHGDGHQESPGSRFDAPERHRQPDVDPEEQPIHQCNPEVEVMGCISRGTNNEREDP